MPTKRPSRPRTKPVHVPMPRAEQPTDYAPPEPTGQTPHESFKERVIRWLSQH